MEDTRSEYTIVNWEIDIQSADRHDVMQSIQPTTGVYLTYPHSDENLQRLYDNIVELRGGTE